MTEPNPWAPPTPQPYFELPSTYAYWGWTPKPPRRGLGRSGVALLVVIVLALASGIATAAVRYDRRDDQRLERLRAQLDRELPELKAFVEAERGLKFLRPVDVELVSEDEFVARLFADPDSTSAEQPETPADSGASLYALHLLDDRDGLDEAVDDAFAETVQGFYDFDKKELVVRGRALNPLTRLVLVHELTHAVQDQHFDLAKADFEGRTDEAELGWISLVEGDANRVDEAYRESLPANQRRELERLELQQYAGIGDDAPEIVYTLLGFPYVAGPSFVEDLLSARGQAGLDRAFREPPTTSEHIMDVSTYLAGDHAVPVSRPSADGKVVDEGALGQLGLGLVVGEGNPEGVRSRAAEGWDGDHYVSYEAGRQVCLRADIVMETAADRDELVEALRQRWGGGVKATGPRTLRLDACR